MTLRDSFSDSHTRRATRVPQIVCISTDIDASYSLQTLVAAIVPEARVESADTSVLRGVPDADCAIVSVGTMYSLATSLVQELRGRGFAGAIILVAEADVTVDGDPLARYGVDARITYASLPTSLLTCLQSVIERRDRALRSPQGEMLLASLQRTRALLSAGAIASTLQHRLNNPLAALLAEAQLLELEPLDSEHAASVRRMVQLCRRVIEVSRSIEGLAEGGAAEGNTIPLDGSSMGSTLNSTRMLPEDGIDGL